MKIYTETERLLLREILPTDVDAMFAMDSDPEVHRYLGNNPVKDKEQIRGAIEFIRGQYVEFGIGRWAIVDKKTNQFIGWAGLKYVTEETNGHINYFDLGYRLNKQYWGNGFATEAALACIEYGFKILELNEIYAMVDQENDGSNKIMKKVGFTFIEDFVLDGIPHNWYKMEKQ